MMQLARIFVRYGVMLMFMGVFMIGCSHSKHSFLIVQGCLSDAKGVAMFFDDMRSIASDERMKFVDNSENTARQLRSTGYAGVERTYGSSIINIGIQRQDGLGVTAGNLGMPGFEIALGFSEGSDRNVAQAFADRVVARLSTRWHWEKVPEGNSAKPIGNCPKPKG